jgi:isocitrate dehydrogenase
MTKDLALCVHGKDLNEGHYLTTDGFLDAVENKLTIFPSSIKIFFSTIP